MFWALWLLSLVLRGMAILSFLLGIMLMCAATVTPIVIPVASIGVIGFIQISYVLVCFGWFFGCLVMYATGQLCVLLINIEENTYMTAKYVKLRREAMSASTPPPQKRKNPFLPPTRDF